MPELLDEIGEALRKPYFSRRVDESAVEDLVAGIADAATVLDDPSDMEAVLRDPEDDYLLALARQGNAEAIVTGDRDLLDHADNWIHQQSALARRASSWVCSSAQVDRGSRLLCAHARRHECAGEQRRVIAGSWRG